MEAIKRKPFQGVTNIVRFNWHFYVLAFLVLLLLHIGKSYLTDAFHPAISMFGLLVLASLIVSLFVSYYVYDVSGLYKFNWLTIAPPPGSHIVNIHAGFDETSYLLATKYPQAILSVFDFYDPVNHTEVSIRRARKAYASYPGTIAISTSKVPLQPQSADYIFCILSAHEIRDEKERIMFFQQLHKSLKNKGKIVVVEHLRDTVNFIAYNMGAFHFHSKRTWVKTFERSGFLITDEKKITPFITAFTCQKNGASY